MLDEEWIKTFEDGRKVKFIYQKLPGDGAFITAQFAAHDYWQFVSRSASFLKSFSASVVLL
jgi:hypothetical protein